MITDIQEYRKMSAALSAQRTSRPFLMVYHDFLEEAMALLSGDAFKVALFIYRETVGRGLTQAPISYTQLHKATGIKRPESLTKAIKEAAAHGFIKICDIVGKQRTKIYASGDGERTTSDGDVVVLPTTSPSDVVDPISPSTTSPSDVVLRHQSTQYYVTSRRDIASPVDVVAPRQPAPQEAPRVPKETYRNVEINDKENVGVELVPADCNQQIENREETMGKVNPVLELMWEGVREEFKGRETPAAFENWIMPLTVVGCEGMVLYLQAKTSYNAQHFQQRFAAQASSILSRHIHQDAEIRCLPPASAGRSA